jgi:hypothetical protein
MERTTGFEPTIFAVGGRRVTAAPRPHESLRRDSNSGPPLYRSGALPLELRRHVLGAQDSDLEALGPKPSGSAGSPTAHREPPFGVEPNRLLHKSRATAVLGGLRVPSATRTRTAGRLGPCLLPLATRTWSRYPGSNRAVRRTKAEPRAARIGMASGAGVEPAGADFRGLLGSPTPHPEPCTRGGT